MAHEAMNNNKIVRVKGTKNDMSKKEGMNGWSNLFPSWRTIVIHSTSSS
jgi:hypothetical protein